MKLGIVCDFYLPDNKAVAHRIHYVAKALKTSGFEMTLYTSKKSKNCEEFDCITNFFSPGSNKDKLGMRLIKELLFAVESFCRLLASRQDLYIVSSPPFTLAFFSMVALWIRGKKVVLDIRDEYPEVYFSEGLVRERGLFANILKRVEHWMYRRAWLITAVTESIRTKLLKKSSRSEQEILLLRNGYAENIEPLDVGDLSQGNFKVIFHGNFGKFQEPHLLGRIAEKCLNNSLPVQFEVYGWGANSEYLKTLNLPNLRFHGEIAHGQMAKLVGAHHLGVSFQKEGEIAKNSFPSKVYEFIGAGIPCLITPKSEAGTFVEEMNVGYQFNPDSVEEIYEKLSSIVNDDLLWQQMRANAMGIRAKYSRKYLSETFSTHLHNLTSRL